MSNKNKELAKILLTVIIGLVMVITGQHIMRMMVNTGRQSSNIVYFVLKFAV